MESISGPLATMHDLKKGRFDLTRNQSFVHGREPLRGWLGALFLIGVYFAFDPIEAAIHAPIANALGLHMISRGEMGLLPYGMLMAVRLCLDLAVVSGVFAILRRPWFGFPLADRRLVPLTLVGLAIGLLVMTAVIAAIIGSGNASVALSCRREQPPPSTAQVGWVLSKQRGRACYRRVAPRLTSRMEATREGVQKQAGPIREH